MMLPAGIHGMSGTLKPFGTYACARMRSRHSVACNDGCTGFAKPQIVLQPSFLSGSFNAQTLRQSSGCQTGATIRMCVPSQHPEPPFLTTR